ncbi:tyrosine-type recombinase/integrase [Cytobacillus oceanisediminis]|uniref:tyrosine-type recombinase/integrase n=1 Tax=Cytobacillus oceanisediminis TaxID=665099 RepID=UPI00254EB428|nr:tyrosine-type recombinase/integrase [Cytobacillus oceanisediminis]MDK7668682.1 tyrosine-type recombinase/integrase [Cytobacillus oceanisediminis]
MERYWELKKVLLNEENQQVVNDFLLSLKLSNRSEMTIIGYRKVLEFFFSEVEEKYALLPPERILEWFQSSKSHLKESTYKQYLTVLSSFYNFCVQESLMESSPIKKRWFPRVSQPVPKFLEKGEIAKVRKESERTDIRDQALVEFLITSGCRLGEVNRLNVGDVDFENRTARVVGKGKKIRQVHFSDKCAILLERYLDQRKSMEGSPLFMTKWSNSRLSKGRIHTIIKSFGEKAGLPSNLYPHRLRHTFATELLSKGAELSFISGELGHADVATTQIYARLHNQMIISQYRKFMG